MPQRLALLFAILAALLASACASAASAAPPPTEQTFAQLQLEFAT